MAAGTSKRYGTIATAQAVGLTLRQLYYWVRVLRVVHPSTQQHGRRRFQYFSVRDVKRLRAMKQWLARGYTLRAAARRATRRS